MSEKKARKLISEAKEIERIPSEKTTIRSRDWRPSRFQSVNPRSRTYVREGTSLERIAVPTAAELGGTVVLGAPGGVVGNSWGRSRSLDKDNVRSYRRKDGAPATSFVGATGAGGYQHKDPKRLRRKARKERLKKSYSISAFGVEH